MSFDRSLLRDTWRDLPTCTSGVSCDDAQSVAAADRRAGPRQDIVVPITVTGVTTKLEPVEPPLCGETVDASPDGIGFICDANPSQNLLVIDFDLGEGPMSILVRRAWSRQLESGRFRVGAMVLLELAEGVWKPAR